MRCGGTFYLLRGNYHMMRGMMPDTVKRNSVIGLRVFQRREDDRIRGVMGEKYTLHMKLIKEDCSFAGVAH